MSRFVEVESEAYLSAIELLELEFPEWETRLGFERQCDCGVCQLCDDTDPGVRR